MSRGRVEHFEGMLRYERWATQLTAQSLASVPAERRETPEFRKAVGIFGHVQQATHVWLSRVGGAPARPFVMFPQCTIEEASADAAVGHEGWERLLRGLTDADLDRPQRYTSTEGVGYESSLAEILTHVFNHATYHRGQIALLVTACGGGRATTDFIAAARRRA